MPILFAVLLLISAVIVRANIQKDVVQPSDETVGENPAAKEEMRGVWVTYMTLDVENETDKETAFKRKIDAIVKDTADGGFNTLVVQVRPFCDAIYPSEIFPWSHILTGEQGVDPGFDPLQYIIDKCRANGLFIHAWINPYRIATDQTPSALSGDNPYLMDESIGVKINGKLYLNPASQKAIDLIASGVRELVENYDIDGVQFDDYFYPEDSGDFDKADYEAYLADGGKTVSLEQFRTDNVSRMVAASYQAAHEANGSILFGISPQGNLANNAGLYADVVRWCAEEGYIDYICPQIYFSLDNPKLTFEDSLDEWLGLKRHEGLLLYVGLAAYKAGTDADEGTWLDNDDILRTEIAIVRKSNADGFILYSYDSFGNEQNRAEIQNVLDYLSTAASQNSSEAKTMRIS